MQVPGLPIALTVLVLSLVMYFTHQRVNLLLSRMEPSVQADFVPSPEAVKFVSLGYDQLLADFYWLEFVGYVGDTQDRQKDRYALADCYLDLITQLDPRFTQAYWFTAFTVGGEQSRPKRAAEIIEHGIAADPNNWYLPFIAGVNQYLFAKNQEAAAKYYRMSARFPGAPNWLERQAETLESGAPRFFKEANSWINIYNSAEEPRVKERARDRCIYLWVNIYKSAPTKKIRARADEVLKGLGVNMAEVERTTKNPLTDL